jgi:predicted ATP-dependent endonuclease of OLD family
MKISRVEISHFKNILGSGPVNIEPDVTCVVGKNESGKTAFLQALHRFNPAQGNVSFNAQRQYPAWLEKQHRRQGNIDKHQPVSIYFKLDDRERASIETRLGSGALKSNEIKITRSYENKFGWEPGIVEHVVVAHIVKGIYLADIPAPINMNDLEEVIALLQNFVHEDESKIAKARDGAAQLVASRTAVVGDSMSINTAAWSLISPLLPKLFYFDEYSQLPGSAKIRELLNADKTKLSAADLTARSLLELAGADNEYLLNPDYETRKRELENIANAITHDVLTYWSTNPELRTEIDITLKTEAIPNGQQQVLDELKIRLYDNRHLLSLGFEERSTGFRWFFSFLAAFSAYENDNLPVVILLDEPGMGLHARAQSDFLRFIDERLSKRCQVIYTTHSPFMVQPAKLERVRLVQDGGRAVGSCITDDILSTDHDTLFPLQGALGYDMVQHLFVAPHNLVVEGTSDFTYISLLSAHLASQGRVGLDPKWSIVPVGGADLIPSFVALLGNHLHVTVLLDSRKEGHQRLQQLTQQGIMKDTRIILIGEIISRRTGDIEDMFTPSEYLGLFNKAFGKSFKTKDLVGSDPIVKRCARLLNVDRFDHGKPATVLLRDHPTILSSLSSETLKHFESLFGRINATLGT